MSRTTVHVQHGVSFWICSGGVSHLRTKNSSIMGVQSADLSRSKGQYAGKRRGTVRPGSHQTLRLVVDVSPPNGSPGSPEAIIGTLMSTIVLSRAKGARTTVKNALS